MASPLSLEALTDRLLVTDLIAGLGACLDEHRFEDLRHLLADDATVATPGGEAAGIEAVIAQAARTHADHPRLQHAISDVLVELEGDRAAARANLVATFAGPEGRPRFSLGEVYRFRARRTAAGWRLSRIEVRPVWRVDAA